ncbi:MAG: hypothetical protein JNL96_01970, partial [Planctomycetaceae bacterium]|nr:hypothetical protein [Planctomycetaceae bacterium]
QTKPAGFQLDQQRTSNRANEITSISRRYGLDWIDPVYDKAGNMKTMPVPLGPTTSLTAAYDPWNRLTSASAGGSSYLYDALNRRVRQIASSVTRHYYYSADWQVLEERLGNSPNSAPAERQFVWGLRYLDDLVLRDRSPTNNGTLSERLYALQDANWNVTAVINASGAVQERYRYTAYGEPEFLNAGFTPVTLGGAYNWETLYAGYCWDAATGLYQVRYRYLHPLLGTWITRDPIGYRAGKNVAQYVNAKPVTYADTFGLAGYWGARDLASLPVGNHHFILLIPDNPRAFPEPRLLTGLQGSLGRSREILGTTIGFFERSGGDDLSSPDFLQITFNDPSDIQAVREIYAPGQYFTRLSDYDASLHKIDPPSNRWSDTDFMFAIMRAARNYRANERQLHIEYDTFDCNCGTAVNACFRALGIDDDTRRAKGTFGGFDSGTFNMLVPDQQLEQDYFMMPPADFGRAHTNR